MFQKKFCGSSLLLHFLNYLKRELCMLKNNPFCSCEKSIHTVPRSISSPTTWRDGSISHLTLIVSIFLRVKMRWEKGHIMRLGLKKNSLLPLMFMIIFYHHQNSIIHVLCFLSSHCFYEAKCCWHMRATFSP